METLERLLDAVVKLMLWLGCVIGVLMMLQITASVAGRAFLDHPIDGSTEIASAYYMVAVTYLPLAWVTRNDDHIFVELFTRGMSANNLRRLDAFVTLVTLLYFVLFTWQTTVIAIQQTQSGEAWESAIGFITVWPSRWQLPLAGGLSSLYLVMRFVRDLSRGFARSA